MAFIPPKDRVLEQSTSNSQTVFTVTGALDVSYNSFSGAGMSIGDTTIGAVVERGVAFKVGLLTYSATNEVTVTTAYDSKGTFSAGGVKEVFMGLPASRAVLLDRPNSFSDTTEATGVGTTAAAIFAGGVEILKKLFVAGIAKFTNATAATSETTGAVVVTGGIGVGGDVYGAGSFRSKSTPGTKEQFDISDMAPLIVNTATNALIAPSASGYYFLLIVELNTNAAMAIYGLKGAGGVSILSRDNSDAWSTTPTTSPAAGKQSVAWSGTAFRIYNNTGSTCYFKYALIRVA